MNDNPSVTTSGTAAADAVGRLSDFEIALVMRRPSADLERLRRIISGNAARIEQGVAQSRPISPVDVRRLEIEAVAGILDAIGESDRFMTMLAAALERAPTAEHDPPAS